MDSAAGIQIGTKVNGGIYVSVLREALIRAPDCLSFYFLIAPQPMRSPTLPSGSVISVVGAFVDDERARPCEDGVRGIRGKRDARRRDRGLRGAVGRHRKVSQVASVRALRILQTVRFVRRVEMCPRRRQRPARTFRVVKVQRMLTGHETLQIQHDGDVLRPLRQCRGAEQRGLRTASSTVMDCCARRRRIPR